MLWIYKYVWVEYVIIYSEQRLVAAAQVKDKKLAVMLCAIDLFSKSHRFASQFNLKQQKKMAPLCKWEVKKKKVNEVSDIIFSSQARRSPIDVLLIMKGFDYYNECELAPFTFSRR